MAFFSEDPEEVAINEKPLRCQVCGNKTFHRRTATLQGASLNPFQNEWLGQPAHCMVCSQCGYIHWFLQH